MRISEEDSKPTQLHSMRKSVKQVKHFLLILMTKKTTYFFVSFANTLLPLTKLFTKYECILNIYTYLLNIYTYWLLYTHSTFLYNIILYNFNTFMKY